MKFDEIAAKGAFVPEEPVQREVTWKHTGEDGEEYEDTFSIFIQRRSAKLVNKMRRDVEKGGDYPALLISSFLLMGDDMKPISFELAQRLDPDLQDLLIAKIHEYLVDKADSKNSVPPTKSGTN